MKKAEVHALVVEARTWLREEAQKLGLPGKGRCYSDPYKKSWSLKVGLAENSHRHHRAVMADTVVEDQDLQAMKDKSEWEMVKVLVSMVNAKYGKYLKQPAESLGIRKGCCSCCGTDKGIRLIFNIDEPAAE